MKAGPMSLEEIDDYLLFHSPGFHNQAPVGSRMNARFESLLSATNSTCETAHMTPMERGGRGVPPHFTCTMGASSERRSTSSGGPTPFSNVSSMERREGAASSHRSPFDASPQPYPTTAEFSSSGAKRGESGDEDKKGKRSRAEPGGDAHRRGAGSPDLATPSRRFTSEDIDTDEPPPRFPGATGLRQQNSFGDDGVPRARAVSPVRDFSDDIEWGGAGSGLRVNNLSPFSPGERVAQLRTPSPLPQPGLGAKTASLGGKGGPTASPARVSVQRYRSLMDSLTPSPGTKQQDDRDSPDVENPTAQQQQQHAASKTSHFFRREFFLLPDDERKSVTITRRGADGDEDKRVDLALERCTSDVTDAVNIGDAALCQLIDRKSRFSIEAEAYGEFCQATKGLLSSINAQLTQHCHHNTESPDAEEEEEEGNGEAEEMMWAQGKRLLKAATEVAGSGKTPAKKKKKKEDFNSSDEEEEANGTAEAASSSAAWVESTLNDVLSGLVGASRDGHNSVTSCLAHLLAELEEPFTLFSSEPNPTVITHESVRREIEELEEREKDAKYKGNLAHCATIRRQILIREEELLKMVAASSAAADLSVVSLSSACDSRKQVTDEHLATATEGLAEALAALKTDQSNNTSAMRSAEREVSTAMREQHKIFEEVAATLERNTATINNIVKVIDSSYDKLEAAVAERTSSLQRFVQLQATLSLALHTSSDKEKERRKAFALQQKEIARKEKLLGILTKLSEIREPLRQIIRFKLSLAQKRKNEVAEEIKGHTSRIASDLRQDVAAWIEVLNRNRQREFERLSQLHSQIQDATDRYDQADKTLFTSQLEEALGRKTQLTEEIEKMEQLIKFAVEKGGLTFTQQPKIDALERTPVLAQRGHPMTPPRSVSPSPRYLFSTPLPVPKSNGVAQRHYDLMQTPPSNRHNLPPVPAPQSSTAAAAAAAGGSGACSAARRKLMKAVEEDAAASPPAVTDTPPPLPPPSFEMDSGEEDEEEEEEEEYEEDEGGMDGKLPPTQQERNYQLMVMEDPGRHRALYQDVMRLAVDDFVPLFKKSASTTAKWKEVLVAADVEVLGDVARVRASANIWPTFLAQYPLLKSNIEQLMDAPEQFVL